MKLLGMLLCRLKSLALLGEDVNDHRLLEGLGKFKGTDQERQIVTVDRSEIPHPHLLEQDGTAITSPSVRSRPGGRLFQ